MSSKFFGNSLTPNTKADKSKIKSSKEVQVTLAYAIGFDQPLQATATVDGVDKKITGYDLSPKGIIEFLDLKKPIFYETSNWGHMGNNFKWK